MARHQTVLLVAADGLIRNVTTAGLAIYGYEVLTASNGQQAADMLRANKHLTLLVTDADLSGEIDGLAVARLAREVNPNIEVIYTSRIPHRIPPMAKVTNAPTLRDPYHPHQLVGVISHLRNRSPETIDRSVA
jgi:CheY-like chemotaxis protein